MTALKQCLKPSCYLKGTKVRTDIEECIACGDDLSKVNPLGDLFGMDPFGGLFSDVTDEHGRRVAAWRR